MTAVEIVRMVEYGVCPSCGDNLKNKTCMNRSRECGKDWSKEYKKAKEAEEQ